MKEIYLISTLNSLKITLFFFIAISLLTLLIMVCGYDNELSTNKESRKNIKKVIITILIMLTINILIPSKEEMYTMLAVKYATEENYNWTKGEIKEGVDYIFEKIEELKNE